MGIYSNIMGALPSLVFIILNFLRESTTLWKLVQLCVSLRVISLFDSRDHFIISPLLIISWEEWPVSCSNMVFPCAALYDSPTGRITIYYSGADTVTALGFRYFEAIVDFLKANSELLDGEKTSASWRKTLKFSTGNYLAHIAQVMRL